MDPGRAVALAALAALAGPAAGQDAGEAFRAAYAHAEQLRQSGTADADEVRGAYAAALVRFEELPAAAREDAQWLPAGAFSAFQADDPTRAVALFEASMAAGNRDAFHAEYLVWSLLRAGRHEEMLAHAHALSAAFPDAVWNVLAGQRGLVTARAWEIADAWLRAGRTDAGLWAFEALVRATDGHPDSLANLALALRCAGRADEAEATYRRALATAPHDPALWNDLGLLLAGTGRAPEAEAAFVESRRLEPPPPTGPATTNLVRLWQRTARPALEDPAVALAAVLRERPNAALARRVYLDVLTERAAVRPR